MVKEPLRAVQVRRFLREQGIAEFKLPDRVECVDSLPLTAVGKVDKKQLRQWLASRASAGRREHDGYSKITGLRTAGVSRYSAE